MTIKLKWTFVQSQVFLAIVVILASDTVVSGKNLNPCQQNVPNVSEEYLTLALRIAFKNSVDPDQMASEEAI